MTITKYEPKTDDVVRDGLLQWMEQSPQCSRYSKDSIKYILHDLTHAEACLREACAEIERLKEMLRLENIDSCSTDATIRAEAKKVMSATLVDGDTHGVPDVTEIVCMLVKEIERLMQLTASSYSVVY